MISNTSPFEDSTKALEVSQESRNRPIGEVAAELAAAVSGPLLARTVGTSDRSVRRWLTGEHSPNRLHERRIRAAHELAGAVADPLAPWVSHNWLLSLNPRLDYHSPSELIGGLGKSANDPSDQATLRNLYSAALAFATSQ